MSKCQIEVQTEQIVQSNTHVPDTNRSMSRCAVQIKTS